MYLKKRLLAVAAVAATAAAVLYGSTLEADGNDSGEGISAWFNHKETIYFWYSDESMTNFINSAAVSFGERENVRVIPVLASEREYLEALNQASVHSEQVPDVYLIGHDSLEKAYLSGLAAPIQDEAGICNGEHFPAAALSAVSYQDKLVAYPFFFETSAFVYNETYLAEWAAQTAMSQLLSAGEVEEDPENHDGIPVDEAQLQSLTESIFANAVPGTIDDILNIANTFELPDGVEGIMKWDVSDIFYNYWLVGNYMIVGGDAGDKPEIININNPETIQCLQVYQALNQFFSMESDTITYESVIADFCQGKIVFTIATADVAEKLAQEKENGTLGFEYGIGRMPQVSETLKSRSMSVTNVVAVNGYTEHARLANRFAAYLTDECADSLYEKTGKLAANLVADTDNEALQVFKAEYADSIPLPKMMETGNFWMQLEGVFSKIWNGADVTALVQELSDQITMQVNAEMQ
ncbi:MAG: extracellular solute-binding protein [Lachnospiraceae bacterium]|nr:extracellular solute-binding protein [Lachnospiraceae bacterium]